MIPTNNPALFQVKAIVVSGRGIASERVETLHKNLVINDRPLFPGTLNLIAKEPIVFKQDTAENGITSRFHFYSILLNGTECWVRSYPQCPLHILEVVLDVNLRENLQLNDGDEVQLEIAKKAIKPIGFMTNLLWILAWKGREFWFYRFNWYPKLISKFLNLRYRLLKLFGLNNVLGYD